jgi:hypothetical protein
MFSNKRSISNQLQMCFEFKKVLNYFDRKISLQVNKRSTMYFSINLLPQIMNNLTHNGIKFSNQALPVTVGSLTEYYWAFQT